MLFNSFGFALFFFITTVAYFAVPERFRRALLLAASYYFYMCWSVRYIAVIIALTLVDYWAGIAIEGAQGGRRRWFLAASVLCNFGLLFVFKYADFVGAALNLGIPALHWLLPVGISFHTFQAVSYTVDVYRGKVKAERSLQTYALYVAFFPQMVAGPIERPGHLMPQLREPKPFQYARLTSGLQIALWGLVKKTVVADLVAPVVTTVYGHPRDFDGGLLCIATLLFAVQIYGDFSGYSDMAVGLARILGYDLTINFREPYRAKSVAEFWQRWHISLSTWFRDYLYIPLGGNRVSPARWAGIVLIVFLVSGLWHGANWTFLVWGMLHGCYVVGGAAMRGIRARIAALAGIDRLPVLYAIEKVLITNILVTVAWVFFRARDVSEAFYVVSHLWNWHGFDAENLFRAGLPRFETAFLPLAVLLMFCGEYLRENRRVEIVWNRTGVRWFLCAAGVYGVVFFGVFERVEFIYFQF